MLCAAFSSSGRFQPTPPARGATGEAAFTASVLMDFNPRPPCGGRPAPQGHVLLKGVISTHAPRAGGDFCAHKVLKRGVNISTHAPRAGGDVLRQRVQLREGVISTHAPRAGGDRRHRRLFAELPGFQPTPPRGGRRDLAAGDVHVLDFNPRPHAGGDAITMYIFNEKADFNPRPHAGGDIERRSDMYRDAISTHAPTRGATMWSFKESGQIEFQPTPPRGGRHCWLPDCLCYFYFNPRPHAGGDTPT